MAKMGEKLLAIKQPAKNAKKSPLCRHAVKKKWGHAEANANYFAVVATSKPSRSPFFGVVPQCDAWAGPPASARTLVLGEDDFAMASIFSPTPRWGTRARNLRIRARRLFH